MSTKSQKYQPLPAHRYALLFPPMANAAFEGLRADIQQNGLRTAITTIVENGETYVLEGVNRQKACVELGITPELNPYQGDDPLAFVITANLHRRHLNPSQLSQLGADLADLPPGRPGKDATLQRSRKAVAALLGVSERSLANASKVKKDGDPALVEAVKAGDVPVNTAAQLAEAPKAEQREALAKAKGQPKPAAKKAIKAAAVKAKASSSSKRKAVPTVKTNGAAKETAAPPSAKDFKGAVNSFASAIDHLFNPTWMAIVEHHKLPSDQRHLVVKYLLRTIQKAKALHDKLEGKK